MSAKLLYQRALRWLSRREYTRHALELKLRAEESPVSDICAVLDQLESQGYVSDQRAAEALYRARSGRYGWLRLQQEFMRQGVTEAVAQPLLSQAKREEIQAVQSVWQKKFGRLPQTRDESGRQARFLSGRGFTLDAIRHVLKGVTEEDD
ncbi:MAG: recombination regulator RecX [Ferrovum sp.]|nr:recombination regulator RecX [Ferrovum sp.]NDU87703.1 recombination regulator RecX [Ferrovum sp.]